MLVLDYVLRVVASWVSWPSVSSKRCFRLSALVKAHFALPHTAVYSLTQPAARYVYNTLISILQMDMGPLTTTPWLMINEQHLELHVLPPRSSNVSFRTRHFVSCVKNELLGVVHYTVPLPELAHAYSCSLSIMPCLYCVWVSMSLCI